MKIRVSCLCPLILLATVTSTEAQETASSGAAITLPETLVTATRYETPRQEIGRSTEVREESEISAQQSPQISETLQTVSGVRTFELSGPGSPGTTPVEIRGFRTSGTQLLLNGLRFSDPTSISGTGFPFFSYFRTEDLSSVEVVKGATSVLYGSEGLAGAVNLLTKVPTEGISAEAMVRGGSFNTFDETVFLNAGTDKAAINGFFGRTDSEGLDEHGNYENSSGYVSALLKPADGIEVMPFVRMISAQNDLDTNPSLGPDGELITNQDTPFNEVESRSVFAGIISKRNGVEGETKLSLYGHKTERDFLFVFDGFPSNSNYDGLSLNADLQHAVEVPALWSTFVAGAEFEHQEIDNFSDGIGDEGQQDRYGVYLKDRLSFFERTLLIDGGARLTHISAVDRTFVSFEGSGIYQLPVFGSRLHSSIAQGFRAPTLFETHGNSIDFNTGEVIVVGNPNLDEERTLTFDFGVAQPVSDEALIDVTFFNTTSDDTILFDFVNQSHVNGGGTETRGIETSLEWNTADWLLLRGAYTYLAKVDGLNHDRLQRRPYNVFAASATARWEALTLFAQTKYRSSQYLDFFGSSERFREGDTTVVDAALTYEVCEGWEVFTRVDNLFDRDYTEAGFSMPGISLFGGLRFGYNMQS